MVKIVDRIRLPYVFDERKLPCSSWELLFCLAVAAAYRTFAQDLAVVIGNTGELKNSTGISLLNKTLPCAISYLLLTMSIWSVWCHEILLLARVEGGRDIFGRILNFASFLCVWRMAGYCHMFWIDGDGVVNVDATSKQFAISCLSALAILIAKYVRAYLQLNDIPRNYFLGMIGCLSVSFVLWVPWTIDIVPFYIKLILSALACFTDFCAVILQCYYGLSALRFDSLIGQRYSIMGTITLVSCATNLWKPKPNTPVDEQELMPSVLMLVLIVFMLWWLYHECVNTLQTRHRVAFFMWFYAHGIYFLSLVVFDASASSLVWCVHRKTCSERVKFYAGFSLASTLVCLTVLRVIAQWKHVRRFSVMRRVLCIAHGIFGAVLSCAIPFAAKWPAWSMLVFFTLLCFERVVGDMFLFKKIKALLARAPDANRISRSFIVGQQGSGLNLDADMISDMYHLDPDGIEIGDNQESDDAATEENAAGLMLLEPLSPDGTRAPKRSKSLKGKKRDRRFAGTTATDALIGSVDDHTLQAQFIESVDQILAQGTDVYRFAAKLENLALNLRRIPHSSGGP